MFTGLRWTSLLLSIQEGLSRWVLYWTGYVIHTEQCVDGLSCKKRDGHALTTAPALQCAPHYTCSAHHAVPGSTCDVWTISLRRPHRAHHAAPHCISQAHHAARRWAPLHTASLSSTQAKNFIVCPYFKLSHYSLESSGFCSGKSPTVHEFFPYNS